MGGYRDRRLCWDRRFCWDGWLCQDWRICEDDRNSLDGRLFVSSVLWVVGAGSLDGLWGRERHGGVTPNVPVSSDRGLSRLWL